MILASTGVAFRPGEELVQDRSGTTVAEGERVGVRVAAGVTVSMPAI